MAVNSDQPLGYTNYSFTSLVLQLQNNLIANQSAWRDMYRSGTGQMLIELFAAVGTLVNYYIERRAEETYLPTAKNYSSAVNLVRLLNYTPKRNVSAITGVLNGGGIQFTLSAPNVGQVYIPTNTSFSIGGIDFVTSQYATLLPGQTVTSVSAIQGDLVPVNYTSNGSANQVYNINDTTIENSVTMELVATTTVLNTAQVLQNLFTSPYTTLLTNVDGSYSVWAPNDVTRPQTISVLVNNVPWIQVSSFINAISTSQYYMIRPELNGTISILFGDGVFGAIPINGANISITYISSAGLGGNIYSTNASFPASVCTLNSTIYDQYGNPQTVTVTNTVPILGGENAETINQIKANAPQVFSAGDRAVTPADFVSLILNFPGVAAVNVFGENENNPPNYNMMNQVQFCIILQNWKDPSISPNWEAALSSYLYSKSLTTVRYSFVSPVILPIVPILYVKLVQGTSVSQIQGQISAAINNMFVLGDTVTFAQPVYQASVIDAIENINGVMNCHVSLNIQNTLLTGYNSSYTYATNMKSLQVTPGSVQLFVGNTLAAVDNGLGNGWTGKNGYTATGVINYTTTGFVGVNSLSPSPSLGVPVTILYQQSNLGDISPTQNQICQLNAIQYSSIGY